MIQVSFSSANIQALESDIREYLEYIEGNLNAYRQRLSKEHQEKLQTSYSANQKRRGRARKNDAAVTLTPITDVREVQPDIEPQPAEPSPAVTESVANEPETTGPATGVEEQTKDSAQKEEIAQIESVTPQTAPLPENGAAVVTMVRLSNILRMVELRSGRQACVELLIKAGINRLSELKFEDYGNFYASCVERLSKPI